MLGWNLAPLPTGPRVTLRWLATPGAGARTGTGREGMGEGAGSKDGKGEGAGREGLGGRAGSRGVIHPSI